MTDYPDTVAIIESSSPGNPMITGGYPLAAKI